MWRNRLRNWWTGGAAARSSHFTQLTEERGCSPMSETFQISPSPAVLYPFQRVTLHNLSQMATNLDQGFKCPRLTRDSYSNYCRSCTGRSHSGVLHLEVAGLLTLWITRLHSLDVKLQVLMPLSICENLLPKILKLFEEKVLNHFKIQA